jgi:hypothetical protein
MSFDAYLCQYGLKLKLLSEFSQESKQTLTNWYRTKPHRIDNLIKAYLYQRCFELGKGLF